VSNQPTTNPGTGSATYTAHLWVDSQCHLAESPRWDDRRGGELVWVDLEAGLLWRWAPDRHAASTALGRATGVAVPRSDGGMITAGTGGFTWIDEAGSQQCTVDLPEDWSVMRMNDGVCDPAGRLLCGSTPWKAGARPGNLYQLSGGGRVRTLRRGLGMSNGMGWSPDGRSFYHVDTLKHSVSVYDYVPETGDLGERRGAFRVDPELGMPDGLTVDADGFLWIAIWGGGRVIRYTPTGEPREEIVVPARYVTSCTFGGADLCDLFITTARWDLGVDELASETGAGGVFHCRLPVSGLPLSRFDGSTRPPQSR